MRKHCKENGYLYAFINNPVYITKKKTGRLSVTHNNQENLEQTRTDDNVPVWKLICKLLKIKIIFFFFYIYLLWYVTFNAKEKKEKKLGEF